MACVGTGPVCVWGGARALVSRPAVHVGHVSPILQLQYSEMIDVDDNLDLVRRQQNLVVSDAVMRKAHRNRLSYVRLADKHQHRIVSTHRGALFIPESIPATCHSLISWWRFCHVQCDGVVATGHSIVLDPALQHIKVPLPTLLCESQVRFCVSRQVIPLPFLQFLRLRIGSFVQSHGLPHRLTLVRGSRAAQSLPPRRV